MTENFINKIILGDCLEVMKEIPDKSIDMILCDLPYGTTACKWDIIIPFEPLWKQYKRIIKNKNAILLFGSEPFSSFLRLSNIKDYKYDWVWEKNQPTGIGYAKYRPMNNHEIISVFYSKKSVYYPQLVESKITDRKLGKSNGKFTGTIAETTGMMAKKKNNPNNILKSLVNPRTVLYFPVTPHSKGYLHPTQKSVELCEYLIKTYTLENEIVLDNCIGSGTTAIACLNTSRRFIGIEKETEYYAKATERVNTHILPLA